MTSNVEKLYNLISEDSKKKQSLFLIALTNPKSALEKILNTEEYKNYTVILSGHSLGGALATLFGYEMSLDQIFNNHSIIVVSFGSPRVGNHDWKIAFNNNKNINHYRVTNTRDIVTALPIWNYYHVGTNIHVSYDSCEINENYSYNPYLKFSLFLCWNIMDHFMEHYYANIKKHPWK